MTDDIETLRTRLNETIAAGRTAEAVTVATTLRDVLQSREPLDERDQKSLDGANAVIERFSAPKATGGIPRWLPLAGLAAVAVVVALLVLRPKGDFEGATGRMLGALEKIDNAVTVGVKRADYDAVTRSLRADWEAYQMQYATEHGGEVTMQGMSDSEIIYVRVADGWLKEDRIAGNFFTINDPVKIADFPLGWRIAHETLGVASRSFRHDRAPCSRNLATLAGRLPGHWGDKKTELYFGLFSDQGFAWMVTRDMESGRLDVRACRLEPQGADEAKLTRFGKYHEADENSVVSVAADGARLVDRTANRELPRIDDNTVP